MSPFSMALSKFQHYSHGLHRELQIYRRFHRLNSNVLSRTHVILENIGHCGFILMMQMKRMTHQKGRLNSSEIKDLKDKANSCLCVASKRDVLATRPLTLLLSSARTTLNNRRVIHIDFAKINFPNGLKCYGS